MATGLGALGEIAPSAFGARFDHLQCESWHEGAAGASRLDDGT